MKRILILVAAGFLSLSASAAEKDKTGKPAGKPMEWTAEQRETMAKVHEQMAVCLRSEKSPDTCHQEMMASCKSGDNCPMMKGHMMHGMKH